MTYDPIENFNAALGIIDTVWATLSELPGFRDEHLPLTRLPDLSLAAAAQTAALGRDLLDRAAKVDIDRLPHDLSTTFAVALSFAENWSQDEKFYWLIFNPGKGGFYGMFAPAPYGGGFFLNSLTPRFKGFPFESAGDCDRYLGLVRDFGRVIRQMHERTAGQAERGIYMPSAQLAQSIALVKGLQAGVEALLLPDRARLSAVDGDALLEGVSAAIARHVAPAYAEYVAFLEDPAYAAAAPETVGLSQYPGGREAYDMLVRLNTTLDLSAEQVHAIGLRRMAGLQAQMRELLDDVGFAGTPNDYVAAAKADPRWRASDPEEIAAVFQRYIDRIAPHIAASFNFKPRAPHGVAALPEALCASMTFGYYSPPTAVEDHGRYNFNPLNLSQAPLNNLAALNYHELIPGHHFHVASQIENKTLHPLRRRFFPNAFNEGWAEYAASLAGEMGLYAEPEERFGRMMNDAFLTCRLVVDTGMNALGWSLEQARDYLRENGFMPETEICSETIRYSCDIPGQALGYKLGEDYLRDAREAMREALGNRFDLRDFHDAVLKPGALPLPIVKRNIERETARLAATT